MTRTERGRLHFLSFNVLCLRKFTNHGRTMGIPSILYFSILFPLETFSFLLSLSSRVSVRVPSFNQDIPDVKTTGDTCCLYIGFERHVLISFLQCRWLKPWWCGSPKLVERLKLLLAGRRECERKAGCIALRSVKEEKDLNDWNIKRDWKYHWK